MAPRALALGLIAVLAGSSGSAQEIEVVLREGTNFAAALAPDGSFVLDLQGTLWRLPAEGGEATALTDGLGDDRAPDVTPDGSRIVFQSYRNGTWDIWSVGADGTDAKALTEGSADDREPVSSPDGRRIAFSSDREGNYDVFVLELETGELSRKTIDAANDYMPAWSPDGRHLAFVSDREPPGLYRINLEGEGDDAPVLLAGFAERIASPSYSPDGASVALRVLDPGVSSTIALVPSDGGAPATLATPADVFPFRVEWPDEAHVTLTAGGSLFRVPIRGGEPENVPFAATVELDRRSYRRRSVAFADARERHPVRGIVRPVLSPDNTMLAYAALGDIWIAPSDGGDPIPMTRDEYLDTDPHWSPDGKHLVFASDRGGSMDLWLKDVEAPPRSGETRLTVALGAELSPAWSPDGTKIVYIDEQARLHVVASDGTAAEGHLTERRNGVSQPSWSSDGVHVAMAVLGPVSSRFREGSNRILIVNTETGDSHLLDEPARSFGTRDGDGPVWKPDGSALAFGMDGGLWVLPVSPDGTPNGRPRQVVGEPVDFPSWSSDGERIVYVSPRGISVVVVATGQVRDVSLRHDYEVAPAAGRFVIRDVRIVDGTGAAPRDHLDVVVQGDRIESVEPTGTATFDGVRVIDGADKTLIPGLIDMHAHLSLPAWGSRHGKVWLAYGVTSIRTPADVPYRVLEERESIDSGHRAGPRVFFTGGTIDGDRIYYNGAHAVGDREELEQELSRAFDLGYDLVKTYVRLPDELQRAVIRAAHAEGLFVTSHEVFPAVAYGVDGIEHISGTSRRGYSPKVSELGRTYDDVVELIAKSGVYLTPTLLLHGRGFLGGLQLARTRDPKLFDDPRLRLFPPYAYESLLAAPMPRDTDWRASMSPYYQTVAAIVERGGRVLAGTDAPLVPYGLSLILEVEQLSEAGLGPLGAIRSATSLAAEALGAGRNIGSVAPGKIADLVLLDGDPTEDIRNLRKTNVVVIGGRLLTVDQLLR